MKFRIERLEDRIAPSRGTLYQLVSGLNQLTVAARTDTGNLFKDGGVQVLNDGLGHQSITASGNSPLMGGGLLPNGQLQATTDGHHQELIMSGHGPTMAAGMLGTGRIQMENFGTGSDHQIVLSGNGGLLGKVLNGGQ